MIINDTSLLSDEVRERLNTSGFIHINTGGKPLTDDIVLPLLEAFSDENMRKFLKAKGLVIDENSTIDNNVTT